MNNVFALVLRRIRAPLLTLIAIYTVAVLGLSLMPGMTPDGQPASLTIFQSFYVISYTATTIGFGEIPYPYSPAQRLWMTFAIYLTVIGWVYAVGKILTLVQDKSLREALQYQKFASEVKRINEPFYLVCGYGETGHNLVNALVHKGMRVVLLDINADRLNTVELQDLPLPLPSLCADASLPDVLSIAGLRHPKCQAVVALTNMDEANLAIAVAVKLLSSEMLLVCRANEKSTVDNMNSFGTELVINPFSSFGKHLELRFHALGACLLKDWLTSQPGVMMQNLPCPPTGKWVVCGHGRFGQAVCEALDHEMNKVVLVESNKEMDDRKHDFVHGKGTEAHTLLEAGIMDSVGVVAGTADDADNLSIVMTARELKQNLFEVVRQNRTINRQLFDAFNADITMRTADIIAQECLAHLISPMLARFLEMVRLQSNTWTNELISRLVSELGEQSPVTWAVDMSSAPAVLGKINSGKVVSLGELLADTTDRSKRLHAFPLLAEENGVELLLPSDDYQLSERTHILFCGSSTSRRRLGLTLLNRKVLEYVLTGDLAPEGYLMRMLIKHGK